MGECAEISILLVDREPAFRAALTGMLREDGHGVFECPDATDLPPLDLVGLIDVLVSAHDMPAQNGVWLADRFHAARPAVPVILLATYRPFALEGPERPFLRLIEKPVPYEALHGVIHELSLLPSGRSR